VTNTYREAAVALTLERGTQSQLERLRAGVLPDEELHAVARDWLFRGIAELPRWVKVDKQEVKQRAVNRGLATEQDEVSMTSMPADSVSELDWQRQREIVSKVFVNDLINETSVYAVRIEPLWLVVTCGAYEKRHLKFRVTVSWLGIDHVREVA
jgi:hypothetical protein